MLEGVKTTLATRACAMQNGYTATTFWCSGNGVVQQTCSLIIPVYQGCIYKINALCNPQQHSQLAGVGLGWQTYASWAPLSYLEGSQTMSVVPPPLPEKTSFEQDSWTKEIKCTLSIGPEDWAFKRPFTATWFVRSCWQIWWHRFGRLAKYVFMNFSSGEILF